MFKTESPVGFRRCLQQKLERMQGKVVESCFASTDAAALNLKCRKTKHEREPKLLSWHDQKTTTLATTTTTTTTATKNLQQRKILLSCFSKADFLLLLKNEKKGFVKKFERAPNLICRKKDFFLKSKIKRRYDFSPIVI